MAIAVLFALVSVPLLMIDDAPSADGEEVATAAPATSSTVAPVDTVLDDRSVAWQAGRAALRSDNAERALAIVDGLSTTTTAPPPTTEAPPAVEVEAAAVPESVPAPAPTVAPTTVAPTTVAPTTTTTTTVAPPPPPPPGGPSAAQWEALRQCESGGRYDAVSPNGLYRGAYQFSQPTWDSVASIHYPRLAGVDPAAAAPADQDVMAHALWTMSGSSPWPHCGSHLG